MLPLLSPLFVSIYLERHPLTPGNRLKKPIYIYFRTYRQRRASFRSRTFDRIYCLESIFKFVHSDADITQTTAVNINISEYTSLGCILTVRILTNRPYLNKKILIWKIPYFFSQVKPDKYFKTYYGAYIPQNY